MYLIWLYCDAHSVYIPNGITTKSYPRVQRTISILMNIRWWIYDEYSLFDPILDPNKFIPTLCYRPPIVTWIYSSHIYLHLTWSGWAVLVGKYQNFRLRWKLPTQLAKQNVRVTHFKYFLCPLPTTIPTCFYDALHYILSKRWFS